MSLPMDQIHRIRQLYYEQGQDNISEIARRTGFDRKTVTKYIDMTDFNEPFSIHFSGESSKSLQ